MMIKQRYEFDCILACLAMASGNDYDELWDMSFIEKIETAHTCTGDNLDEAFRRAGYIKDVNMKCVYVNPHSVSSLAVRDLLWKRKAMIQVDSLNYERGMHMIYWTGTEILDPSPKQVYTWWQNIHPVYVWIFDDEN